MAYQETNVFEKVLQIDSYCELAFHSKLTVPDVPARNIEVLLPEFHPDKKGLSFAEGQARLLHDLANIEMQAMELGLRTLQEYPEAPLAFREDLIAVIKSESTHLDMCLKGIDKLGYQWGDWPIHNVLWNAVSSKDSLIDRVLIVHRYLEGSGLDAGDTLLRRLTGIADNWVLPILKIIFTEEIDHVNFGSRWYRELCRAEGLDPQNDFPERMQKLKNQIPRRIEKISEELRLKAGFTQDEITWIKSLRESFKPVHPGRT